MHVYCPWIRTFNLLNRRSTTQRNVTTLVTLALQQTQTPTDDKNTRYITPFCITSRFEKPPARFVVSLTLSVTPRDI